MENHSEAAHVSLLSQSFIQKLLSDDSVPATMAATENNTRNKSDPTRAFVEIAFQWETMVKFIGN